MLIINAKNGQMRAIQHGQYERFLHPLQNNTFIFSKNLHNPEPGRLKFLKKATIKVAL